MEEAARPTTRTPRGRFVSVTSARARPAAVPKGPGATAIARHLILACRPGWQSLDDLNAIARHVGDIDPTIATFIVPTTHRNPATRKKAAERPSLVVSPGPMPVFRPLRGKVYQGSLLPKIEEVRRLQAARIPVPRTEILTPDLTLDPADWGEFVIVKPTDIPTSSHGRGIQLMRTRRVRYLAPGDYPEGHPGRLGPMIVQQFIDTGGRIHTFRVLTLFGEPVSAVLVTARTERIALSASDDQIETAAIAIQGSGDDRERILTSHADVLALARAAHEAVPEVPLKGVDLLRDVVTGKLYVIELNCGGNTWYFSSNLFAETLRRRPELAIDLRRQFDAMRTAARVLADRTNAEAE